MKSIAKLLLLLVLLMPSIAALAQMGGPPPAPHIQSLSIMAANSKTVVTGQVESVDKKPINDFKRMVTVHVQSVLKGTADKTVSVPLWFSGVTFDRWRATPPTLVVSIPQDPKSEPYAIELSAPNMVAFDENFNLVRKPEDVLDDLRRLIRRYQHAPALPVFEYQMSLAKLKDTVLAPEYGNQYRASLDVPLDQHLESQAIRDLKGPDAVTRERGVLELSHFKTPRNAELLKQMLQDPTYFVQGSAAQSRGIENHYFPARNDALNVLRDWGYTVRNVQINETVNLIDSLEELDLYGIKASDDFNWLMAAKKVKKLQMWGGPLTDLQIHAITQLDSLTYINASNMGITDDDLTRLSVLKHLQTFILSENPITDASAVTLKKFPELKTVWLENTQLTAGGYAELRQGNPNLEIWPANPSSPANFYADAGDLVHLRQVLNRDPDQLNRHDLNRGGNTPLHSAAERGHYDVVRYLLEKGADIEAVNQKGETPLWVAIRGSWGNRDSVIRLLLKHGADINHPDNNGDTPLHAAIDDSMGDYGGNTRFLITTGADPFLKDKAGKLPLDLIRYPAGPEIDRLQALVKLMEQPVPLIPQTNAACDHLIYQTQMDNLNNWSSTPTGRLTGPLGWSKAPLSDQYYLGPFGQQAVTLNLSNLPAHKNVRVEVELWVLGSWDGNGGIGPGPDIIDISIPGIGTAMHSSFFNCNEGDAAGLKEQSFPDPYPLGHHLGYTGATLAHQLPFETKRTAAYKLSYTFAHSDSGIAVVITGMNVVDGGAKTLLDDEHWGIASVTVKTD